MARPPTVPRTAAKTEGVEEEVNDTAHCSSVTVSHQRNAKVVHSAGKRGRDVARGVLP